MIPCPFCKTFPKSKTVNKNHIIRCPSNPHRIKASKWSAEAKANFSRKCCATNCNNEGKWTLERRAEAGVRNRIRSQGYWTEEKREEHSLRMQQVVRDHPDSYSKENVSGRVKMHSVTTKNGLLVKVKGSWEKLVAESLELLSIEWTNSITPFAYTWRGKQHSYFPDFYLPLYDLFIEVKGFKTTRDEAKWKSVSRLLIIESREIQGIKEKADYLKSLVASYSD